MKTRIVSLLPSATEIICALGLESCLVGVTHECDYPPAVRALPKVTHTLIPTNASSAEIDGLVRERLATDRALYTLNVPMLQVLQPDLIVTQALCDVCAVAESEVRTTACHLPGNPVVVNLEPQTLNEVFDAICQAARAVGVPERAESVVNHLRTRVDDVIRRAAARRGLPLRIALLEWLDPPFSCGHWNPELVRLAGGIEGLGHEGVASRTLTWNEVIAWRPEVVVIACCGFDVARTTQDVQLLAAVPGWADLPAVRAGRVFVIDGAQYFSRPGPRLVDSLELIAHTIDADLHPLPTGLPAPVRVCATHAGPHEAATGQRPDTDDRRRMQA